MVLCNQGCGTRIFFQIDKETGKNRPYNVHDKEKHVCPIMEMSKMYGGKWNTIPMNPIKLQIYRTHSISKMAFESRNIDRMLRALETTINNLKYVTGMMEEQEKKNTEWAGKLKDYQKKLVADQNRREKEKRDTK